MGKRPVGSLVALLIGGGLALAQPPAIPDPPPNEPARMTPLAADLASAAVFTDESPGSVLDRLWLSSEYLLWWFKKIPEPVPLATSGSLTARLPGALGQPGTRVVLGGQSIDTEEHSGGRFTAGSWLDDERTFGVEASYFFLPTRGSRQTVATSGLPGASNLAVPVFDVSGFTSGGAPGESVFVLPGPLPGRAGAIPGFTGLFTLATTSRLQGAEVNGVFNLAQGGRLRVDAVAGFRWLQLREDLNFTVQTAGVPGSPFTGQFFNSVDALGTRNDFYGGQLGVRAAYRIGRFSAEATAKVGLGALHESADIHGQTQTSSGTLFFPTGGLATQPFPTGIFAQASNSGHHGRDRFEAVPEVDMTLGYQATDWARLFVGYSFIYLGDVARSGDLIDRNINTTRARLADISRAAGSGIAAVGPAGPTFGFHDSSFWAQGISFGLELRY